jgi:hypothetical protein
VPRRWGGAISIRYIGAEVEAKVEKNDNKKRPPIKADRVGAVLVTTVPD